MANPKDKTEDFEDEFSENDLADDELDFGEDLELEGLEEAPPGPEEQTPQPQGSEPQSQEKTEQQKMAKRNTMIMVGGVVVLMIFVAGFSFWPSSQPQSNRLSDSALTPTGQQNPAGNRPLANSQGQPGMNQGQAYPGQPEMSPHQQGFYGQQAGNSQMDPRGFNQAPLNQTAQRPGQMNPGNQPGQYPAGYLQQGNTMGQPDYSQSPNPQGYANQQPLTDQTSALQVRHPAPPQGPGVNQGQNPHQMHQGYQSQPGGQQAPVSRLNTQPADQDPGPSDMALLLKELQKMTAAQKKLLTAVDNNNRTNQDQDTARELQEARANAESLRTQLAASEQKVKDLEKEIWVLEDKNKTVRALESKWRHKFNDAQKELEIAQAAPMRKHQLEQFTAKWQLNAVSDDEAIFISNLNGEPKRVKAGDKIDGLVVQKILSRDGVVKTSAGDILY